MLKPRRTRRQDILAFNAADRFYAAAAGKAPAFQQPVPALRGPRVDHPDLEKHVVREVGELLAVHPKVLWALRMNSGAASYEASTGKYAPVWFHKWIRSPQKCRMADYFGGTVDSRIIALECKHRQWTKPGDTREEEQANFLALVRKVGGIGRFVRSSEEANEVLNG